MQLHLPTNQHIFCFKSSTPPPKKKQLHLLQQIRRKQAVERADGGRGKAYVFKKSFLFCKCSGLWGRGKAYIFKKKKNRLCFLFLRHVGKLDYLFFISKPCARTGAVARHTFLRSLFFFCKCSGLWVEFTVNTLSRGSWHPGIYSHLTVYCVYQKQKYFLEMYAVTM